jgi:uncharacterized protein YkwD
LVTVGRNTVAGVVCSLCLTLALLAPSMAHAQACSTSDPQADIDWTTLPWNSDQDVQNDFTNARAAEGCNVPLVLPAGFDGMSAQQQMFSLFNNEREVRGLPDLQLDNSLMSQIALNHSQEMAQYGYFEHESPINQGQNVFARDTLNPALAPATGQGEDISTGFGLVEAVFTYMYDDSSSQWGHREAILGNYNWVGIGVLLNAPNSQNGNYYTDDFANLTNYTPPAAADTNPPVVGPVSYSNGTATVSGVADSPLNVNDTGANPATAGITNVSFYTNNIVQNPDGSFNTVAATQTAAGSGTWTAPITVNPGDVLHAVAVDGSGNFTDMSTAPPAMTLTAGANTVAIPAATPTTTTPMTAMTASDHSGAHVPAATPTAAALVASVDTQLHRKAVTYVRVYINGHWRTYTPGGKARNFPLYTSEGVVLGMKTKGKWRPPAGDEPYAAPTLRLHKGWNFVAAPYPITHMTCHATRLELARHRDKLLQITVGPSPTKGVFMRPNRRGQWGNDIHKVIPDHDGFWIKDTGTDTWTPNATQYGHAKAAIK